MRRLINPKKERKKVKMKRKIMHLEKARDLNKKRRKKTSQTHRN